VPGLREVRWNGLEKRRKNGLCFKCGKKGLIKDCLNHPTVTTVKKIQMAAKPTTNKDADYQEFLEWKAFKARQIKKQSEEADFAWGKPYWWWNPLV
jgi:hypothetical protein